MDQLTQFNNGGTHEQNPLGGIPQGMDNQGVPNLVEEGETKLDAENYIFSDRLKVDREIAGIFNLPSKFIGKTFAEVSKKLDFSDSRREGDKIEENQSKKDLSMLMEAQEKFKQLDLEKDLAMMKEKHPEFMEFMEQSSQGAPQEQMVQDPNMMQNPEQGGEMVYPAQQGMPEIAPEQMQQMDPSMQEGVPQSPIPGMRYGGSMFGIGGYLGKPANIHSTGGVVNYNDTTRFEDSAAQSQAEEQNTQNTIGQVEKTASVIPIVGAALGVGNAIGKPIKNAAEKRNEDGTLKNEQGAQAGYIANTFVNPASSFLRTMQDKDASTGQKVANALTGGISNVFFAKKYTDKLNNEGKVANYQPSEQTNELAQQTASETYYADGGFLGDPPVKNTTTPTQVPVTNTPVNPLSTGMLGNAEKVQLTPEERLNITNQYKADTGQELPVNFEMNPAHYETWQKSKKVGFELPYSSPTRLPSEGIVNHQKWILEQGRKQQEYKDERELEKSNFDQRTQRNNDIIKTLSPEQIAEIKALKITPEKYISVKGQKSANIQANGGKINYFDGRSTSFMQSGPPYGDKGYYTGELTEEELAQEAVKAQQQRMLYSGSGRELSFTPQGQTDLTAFAQNENDPTLQNKDKFDGITTDPNQRGGGFGQGENEDANIDYRFDQTLLNTAGTYAPIAYNLAKGIFGKQDKRKLEDYYKEVEAYKMNIDPQLRETEQSFAAGQNAIRNAGTGTSYLATMKQMADSRNKSFADLHGQKQQFDIAQKYNTDVLNNQNRSQAQMFIDDYNARAKSAKTAHLQEGVKQMSDVAQSDTQNKLAMQYNRLYAPDFAGQTGRVTLDEQFRNYMNARRVKQGK